jgi:hypothetical protein
MDVNLGKVLDSEEVILSCLYCYLQVLALDSESFLISSRGGYAGSGVQGNFAIMERSVGGDELLVQETRGKKLPLDSQAKIEGRRGQNWTNGEVEALIALRGEMHEEFERNKQKQGTFLAEP